MVMFFSVNELQWYLVVGLVGKSVMLMLAEIPETWKCVQFAWTEHAGRNGKVNGLIPVVDRFLSSLEQSLYDLLKYYIIATNKNSDVLVGFPNY